jgi:hypothetical protein
LSNIIEFPQPAVENEVELVEYVFTNDHTNPYPQQILHLLYDSVFKNLVGIMQAKHRTTGDVHTLLVGLEKAEEGSINTYPLARILSLEEQNEYLAPDGKGGFPDVSGD